MIWIESKKKIVERSHNKYVKQKKLSVEDWVLCKALGIKVDINYKKFTTMWEDPYQIYEITLRIPYRIENH